MSDDAYTTTEPHADPEIVRLAERPTLVVRYENVTLPGIERYFDEGFRLLGEALAHARVQAAGAPFARYDGMPPEPFTLELGFPIDWDLEGIELPENTTVTASTLRGGRVAVLSHLGGYDGLGTAWQRLGSWAASQGVSGPGDYFEVYVTEPSPEASPADMRTDLFLPLN